MRDEAPSKNGDGYTACDKFLFFVLFFVMGMINNLGYSLILTGSQRLAKGLNNQSLIALYPLALIAFSSLARIINSKFCIKVSYIFRITFLSVYFFCGYISLFVILNFTNTDSNKQLSKLTGFLLTLIPSFIMGTGSSFGEASLLGFLRLFPKDLVAGWSSGTGLAGVSGATITLLVKLYGLDNKFLFLYVSPVCAVYFLVFLAIHLNKKRIDKSTYIPYVDEAPEDIKIPSHENEEKEKLIRDTIDSSDEDRRNTQRSQENEKRLSKDDFLRNSEGAFGEVPESKIGTDVSKNLELSCANFALGFKKSKKYIINLALVYYLEYVILSGISERISDQEGVYDKIYFKEIVYETFSLCYQLGVLLSRSSLIIVKHIPHVEIFTVFQFLNLVLWVVDYYVPFIKIIWILMALLVIVGLFGGAAYVGCFYFLLNSEEIDEEIKELCVNIGTIFNDCGIMLASLTVLLLDNTIMKN